MVNLAQRIPRIDTPAKPTCVCGASLRSSIICRPCRDRQVYIKKPSFKYSKDGFPPEQRPKFTYTITKVDNILCSEILQQGTYYKGDTVIFDPSRVPAGRVKLVCMMEGYKSQEAYIDQQGNGMKIKLSEWEQY